jgi:hypothetical protein
MLWRMFAEPHLDRIGIMLARLDNLPQRHRSVKLHAAAPDVDFRTSMRCERIPGRHDPGMRNFPSHACHAKPPAIGISLAEIAGITRSWQRPARAGPRDWLNVCGNRRKLPAETLLEKPSAVLLSHPRGAVQIKLGAERAERSETPLHPYISTGRGPPLGVGGNWRKLPAETLLEKPSAVLLSHPRGAVQALIGVSLAEIAGIAETAPSCPQRHRGSAAAIVPP